ncbi:MAG: FAD-binding protein, partial [Clostridia bacterium]|nr:FAD-binding protein [Clostridia bacterium]
MKKLLSLVMAAAMLLSMVTFASAEEAVTVKQADIIIVGAGGAGLAAAIEAVDNGASSVIILEKTGKTGGSLNFTSGSMSGAETVIQQIDGIEDTKESFVQDILSNGAHLGNEEMIRAFVEEDVNAIQWLWDNGLKDYNFSSMKTTGKRSVFAPEHQLYSVART